MLTRNDLNAWMGPFRGATAIGATLIALVAQTAEAGRRVQTGGEEAATPLASLLQRNGWDPSPDLTGAFRPGMVLRRTDSGAVVVLSSCFSGEVLQSPYASREVSTSLSTGVSVQLPWLSSMSGSAEHDSVVRFTDTTHLAIPELEWRPTEACIQSVTDAVMRGTDLAVLVGVREVLLGQMLDSAGTSLAGSGRFAGVGAAEGAGEHVDRVQAERPVVLGIRVVPLLQVPEFQSVPTRVEEARSKLAALPRVPLHFDVGAFYWIVVDDQDLGTAVDANQAQIQIAPGPHHLQLWVPSFDDEGSCTISESRFEVPPGISKYTVSYTTTDRDSRACTEWEAKVFKGKIGG